MADDLDAPEQLTWQVRVDAEQAGRGYGNTVDLSGCSRVTVHFGETGPSHWMMRLKAENGTASLSLMDGSGEVILSMLVPRSRGELIQTFARLVADELKPDGEPT